MKKNWPRQTSKPMLPLETGLEPKLENRKPVHGILFDVYGTLFISGSGDISIARKGFLENERLEKLLQAHGIEKSPADLVETFFQTIEAHHQEMRRRGIEHPEVRIEEIWQEVLNWNDEERTEAFAVEYEMIVNPAYPMPHLEPVLNACKNRLIAMGIVSNAQFFTLQLFDRFLGRDCWSYGFNRDLCFLSYQMGRAKPSLSIFHKAASALEQKGIPPHETIYVGNDMLNDIYPAARTGFQTALFAGDSRSLRLREDHPMCRELRPDYVVTDLSQLLVIIQQ